MELESDNKTDIKIIKISCCCLLKKIKDSLNINGEGNINMKDLIVINWKE